MLNVCSSGSGSMTGKVCYWNWVSDRSRNATDTWWKLPRHHDLTRHGTASVVHERYRLTDVFRVRLAVDLEMTTPASNDGTVRNGGQSGH